MRVISPEQREANRLRSQRWREANAGYHRARERARYWETGDHVLQRHKETPEVWRRAHAKRNAAPGTVSKAAKREIKRDPCAYCGGKAEHTDHCTPISRGGRNDIHNCVAACSSCNYAKSTKTVLEFLNLWPRAA